MTRDETRRSSRDNSTIEERLEPDKFFEDAVVATYDHLLRKVDLASTMSEKLLRFSLQGRTVEGAWTPAIKEAIGKDRKICYPNTTREDVIEALGLDVSDAHTQHQKVIDDIRSYFNRVFDFLRKSREKDTLAIPNKIIKLWNKDRRPLAGIKFFEQQMIIHPLDVLIGAYIGSCVDSYKWREKTEEEFGIKMHKGYCGAVNYREMRKCGITLSQLANLKPEDDIAIDNMVNWGVLSKKNERYSKGYRNAFIQLDDGFGISDDAVFMAVALFFGLDAAYGFLLADAIDTWDKSTERIVRDGQDEVICRDIKPRYEKIFGQGSFPCTDDDILNIIYLASINETDYGHYPSCSQKRFVQINPSTGLCAVDSHVAFHKYLVGRNHLPDQGGIGGLASPMKLACSGANSYTFYHAFRERYATLFQMDRITDPIALPSNGNGNH